MLIALIDGDILAHNCCYNRTDGVTYLDDEGNVIPQVFTKEEDTEYRKAIWRNFESMLEVIMEETFADDYCMAVKGEGNYRDEIFVDYKKHRTAGPPNLFVPFVRKLAVMHEIAIAADGREADDLLRIWANECRSHNIDYVICSIDKDLLMIPGKHYNIKHKTITEVSELDAKRNFYEQVLKGDATDNIPGIWKMGPVKASKALAHCTTDEEFQEAVIEQYIKANGDEWPEYLLANAKLINIQNTYDDYFCFDNWPLAQEIRDG
jgi:5'-3' exonuclease